MNTDQVLRVNRQQVAQLTAHCRAYRSYLWQRLLPSPERNQALRGIQEFQGRLERLQEQQTQADLVFSLSGEEKSLLKQLFGVMMRQYATVLPSDQRTQALGEIASLRLLVERTVQQTQAR